MAQKKPDLLSRLADRGEQMVGRITDLPGAKQLVDRVATLAKGLDDVQRKVRSLDPLEKRVTQIEKRLAKLEGKGSPSTRKTAPRPRPSSAKSSPGTKSTSSSAKRSTSSSERSTSRPTRRRSS
ncbi:MAG: hypothetical protein H0V11_01315 [Actinobacteria bacterium]|nr:hypothetical protein [Actinomycetota bacterium]